jgi:hypothetical protein
MVIEIVDLPGDLLGWATPGRIQIDVDAAGHGWFVDPTPYEDTEFEARNESASLAARVGSEAENRVDLLTAVMHELGHLSGEMDETSDNLMGGLLWLGTRRLPAIDSAFADGV